MPTRLMKQHGCDSPRQPGGIPALGQPGWTDGSWTSTMSGGAQPHPGVFLCPPRVIQRWESHCQPLPLSIQWRTWVCFLMHLAKWWAEPGETSRQSAAARYLGHDACGLESPSATAFAEEAHLKLMGNIRRKRTREKRWHTQLPHLKSAVEIRVSSCRRQGALGAPLETAGFRVSARIQSNIKSYKLFTHKTNHGIS